MQVADAEALGRLMEKTGQQLDDDDGSEELQPGTDDGSEELQPCALQTDVEPSANAAEEAAKIADGTGSECARPASDVEGKSEAAFPADPEDSDDAHNQAESADTKRASQPSSLLSLLP